MCQIDALENILGLYKRLKENYACWCFGVPYCVPSSTIQIKTPIFCSQ